MLFIIKMRTMLKRLESAQKKSATNGRIYMADYKLST